MISVEYGGRQGKPGWAPKSHLGINVSWWKLPGENLDNLLNTGNHLCPPNPSQEDLSAEIWHENSVWALESQKFSMSLTFQGAVNPQHYRPGGLKVAKPLQVSGWETLSWWGSPPIGRCGQLEVMVSGHMVFKGLDSRTCGSLSTFTIYPQKSKGSQWVETRNRWRWALEKHPIAYSSHPSTASF